MAFNPRSNLVATGEPRPHGAHLEDELWASSRSSCAGTSDAVTRVRFTPDGSRIVTVSTDGTERMWDPEPEPLMHVVRYQARSLSRSSADVVADVAEVPQGKRARAVDESTRLDPRRGLRRPSETDAPDSSGSVRHDQRRRAFSPDGRWVVTAGPFSAGLWRSNSSGIHTYLRDTDRPVVAEFTSDRRIVTLARDGKVREWICDYCGTLDELIRTAKTRLAATGRTFTRGERAHFLSN